MRISEIVHVLEQPATNPCADLKMWIGKNKEGIHKDHLVYFVNNSLAQPKGTQLQRHSPCNPWSWPSGAPNSFLQRQVKDSVVLYCTEQPNSAIHLLLHLNLLYIYFALLGSKAREGCLGDTSEPLIWVCLEHHCTNQTEQHHRMCLWPELLHLLQRFRTQLSSEVSPSDIPQQGAGLLEPFSGASLKHCAENMEELLRVCLPNHPAPWPGRQADTFLPIKRKSLHRVISKEKNILQHKKFNPVGEHTWSFILAAHSGVNHRVQGFVPVLHSCFLPV